MRCLVHQEAITEFTCPGCKREFCHLCRDEYLTEYCEACASGRARVYLEGTKLEITRKRNTRHWLGWYQIVGGSLGVLMSIFFGFQMFTSNNRLSLLVIFGCFLVLNALLLIAGVLILKDRKYGKHLTIIVQCLQIPQFGILGVTYKFVSGLAVMLSLRLMPGFYAGFDFHLFNAFKIALSSKHTELYLSINVIPILLIYYVIGRGSEYK